ncbi:MAG: helix-turn-helix domain-containing protein [Deltaproteobacteria bacterium]|nr:helix-turn-helix domain-containing protein [Deltaproteobacteria bacterium]MCW5805361.1 helix-turn-helix domain-containing protein [Deltaproteobacteria bacterium]
MRICVLVVDDVFDAGLALLLDTFETANELAGETRFRVAVCSPCEGVRTHHGFAVPVDKAPARAPDLAIVPALACKQPETILAALARDDVAEVAALVRRYGVRSRVAAACTGTFVLGRAGVLDGRRATTSWWLGPTFRREFPAVELDETNMVVSDARTLTAGAALAHVDLALAVVRERSPELASLVARYLLLDDRPSQAPFIAPAQVALDDELVVRFDRWVRAHLAQPFDLPRAARAIGTSERTLQRRVRAVLGKSPIAFVQDLRIERAVHLLRVTEDTVDAIAAAVGYEDGSTLRTLLRRRLHTGVRDLR